MPHRLHILPTACPKCRSVRLHFATKDDFPDEWHVICADCIWTAAYGDHALAEACRITAKLNQRFRSHVMVEDYKTRVDN